MHICSGSRRVRCALGLPAALALVAVLFVAPALAQPEQVGSLTSVKAEGELKLVEARTEIHKERSTKAQVVAVLAPGEHIKTGYPREGWLAVFRMNDPATNEATAVGYVPEGMVRSMTRPTARSGAKSPGRADLGTGAAPEKKTTAAVTQAKPVGRSAPAPELKGEVKEGSLLGGGQPGLNKQDPVRITSDKLTYNQAENSVVFVGNVHATHGNMALWSERLTAYFVDKGKTKEKGGNDFADKIERIVADGDVRMVANKNEGQCATLTYFVAEGMLRMDGNPILREGQNTVRGDTIKFYMRDNRSEVLSGKQRRVEAIFFTPGSEKK